VSGYFTPQRLYTRERTTAPIQEGARWPPLPICTFCKSEKSLISKGFRTLKRPAAVAVVATPTTATPVHNNKTVIILLLFTALLMTRVTAVVPAGQICRVLRKAFVHTGRQWRVITLEHCRPQQRGIATKPN
jgi:hypothetical protein